MRVGLVGYGTGGGNLHSPYIEAATRRELVLEALGRRIHTVADKPFAPRKRSAPLRSSTPPGSAHWRTASCR